MILFIPTQHLTFLGQFKFLNTERVLIFKILYFQTNNVDDNGLVEGKWDGSFEDGTSPFAWISSTPIFEEFYNTRLPVKYGQCWVFSGVIVTSMNLSFSLYIQINKKNG